MKSSVRFDSRPLSRYTLRVCLICIDLDRGAMSLREARRALGEMQEKLGPEHTREVEEKLRETEQTSASQSAKKTP